MVWVPDTDYPPAQQHVGYPVSVLADGADTGATPLPANDAVIGWRAGCDCGWRGGQFYPRAEWPSTTGAVPAAVEGWEGATATCGEWVHHVLKAVPELSIYELARHLADTNAQLSEAVRSGRRAGLSWSQIAQATGTEADHAARRWGPTATRSFRSPAHRQDRRASGPESGPAR
jgi:hypothetical protein